MTGDEGCCCRESYIHGKGHLLDTLSNLQMMFARLRWMTRGSRQAGSVVVALARLCLDEVANSFRWSVRYQLLLCLYPPDWRRHEV